LEVEEPTLRLAMFSLLYPSSRGVSKLPSRAVVSPPNPEEKSPRSCDTRGRLKFALRRPGAAFWLGESLFTGFAVLGLLEVPLLPLATMSVRWLDDGGVAVKNCKRLQLQCLEWVYPTFEVLVVPRRTMRRSDVAVAIPARRLGCSIGRILVTVMLGWVDDLALKLLQLFLDSSKRHWKYGEDAM